MNGDKLKILLLSVSSTSFFYEQLVIPFGLVSIGSYVDAPDYELKGIEMNFPPQKIMNRYLKEDDEILAQILDFEPDIIAMSTYATNMYNVMFWADVIKKNMPDTFVVVGGNHVSYIAEECLKKCSGIDAVIRFEGEIPFKMLCERLHNGNRDLSGIPSLSYRAGEKHIENPQAELIKDLNYMPLLNRTYFVEHQSPDEVIHADMISARGCPFNCTFCNCNHYWSKRHRTRSVESVIEELIILTKRHPLKTVRFRDEAITLNKKHCIEICNEIVKNNIQLKFQAHSRLDGLDEEVIQALSKAGFTTLFIGIESGSKKVLDRLKKGIDISRLETVISLLRKYGISFRLSFMSATPGENIGETLKTVRLIRRLKLRKDEYYLGYGVDIYPGTGECEQFIELNPDYQWISKKPKLNGTYLCVRDHEGNVIQPKYREYGIISVALIYFLLRPTYFLEKVVALSTKIFKRIFRR
ncbi:MAG: B12-binding domain-containing radical SAM protein [Deltaproteobacteria bacterium]|nr:B12-binding domain-containing radical SAM protein [Deltaproteobacteria bacterium]